MGACLEGGGGAGREYMPGGGAGRGSRGGTCLGGREGEQGGGTCLGGRVGTIHRCIDISRYFSRDIIFYNHNFFFFFNYFFFLIWPQ